MKTIRNAIATWLDPEMAERAKRYRSMRLHAQDAFWWLGEFPDAQAALHWLLKRDTNVWRALSEPHSGSFPTDISGFRQLMRDCRHVELMNRDLFPTPSPKDSAEDRT